MRRKIKLKHVETVWQQALHQGEVLESLSLSGWEMESQIQRVGHVQSAHVRVSHLAIMMQPFGMGLLHASTHIMVFASLLRDCR